MGWVHQSNKPLSRTVMSLSHYPFFCHAPALSAVRRIQEHPPFCGEDSHVSTEVIYSWGSPAANSCRKCFILLYLRVLRKNVHNNNVVVTQWPSRTKPKHHCHKTRAIHYFYSVSSMLVNAQILFHSFAWCQVNRSDLSNDLICLFQKFWQNISISLIFLQIRISRAGHLCQLSKDSSGLVSLLLYVL